MKTHFPNLNLIFIFMILSTCLVCLNECTSQLKSGNPMNFPHSTDSLGNKMITIPLSGLAKDAVLLEMVLIPAGEFNMGSSADEPGRDNDQEWPAHPVKLSKPFYMGKFEVTQAQWEAVLGPKSHRSKFKGQSNYPVEKVSWRECQKLIHQLNTLGLGKFRLPTEAEWEYACRAGSQTPYFFGNSLEFADLFMWHSGNANSPAPLAVGQKRPNPWGLYDMHGNVLEWCADQWEDPHTRPAQTDPRKTGSSVLFFFSNRIFKGGSYREGPETARAACRSYEQEIDYHYSLGFRLVREVD